MKTTRPTLAKTTLALLVTAGLLGSASTNAANVTWSNAPSSTNFNLAADWAGGAIPANASTLIFSNSTQTNLNNDITSLSVTGIVFSTNAASYTISGNAITLTGGITNFSGKTETINDALTITANTTFTDTNAGSVLNLNGTLSGSNIITFQGGGAFVLGGQNLMNSSTSGFTIATNTSVSFAVSGALQSTNTNTAASQRATVLTVNGGTAYFTNSGTTNIVTAPNAGASNNEQVVLNGNGISTNLLVSNNATLQMYSVNNGGTVLNMNNAVLVVGNGGTLLLSLTNQNTAPYLTNGSSIYISGGGTLVSSNTANFVVGGGGAGTNQLINSGTFSNASTGANAFYIGFNGGSLNLVSNSGTFNAGTVGTYYIGNNALSSTNQFINTGTFISGSNVLIGNTNAYMVDLFSNSASASFKTLQIGSGGGYSNNNMLIQGAGTTTIISGGSLVLGQGSNSLGCTNTLWVTGGLFTSAVSATIGLNGTNTMNILQVDGGTATFSGNITMGTTNVSSTDTNKIILNGGTLAVNAIVVTNNVNSTNTLTINGGTLAANASGNLLDANLAVMVNSNFTLDTGNNKTTNAAVTTGSGGFTKIGVGTLALTAADTLTGNVNVQNGLMVITNSGSLPNAPINITSTGSSAFSFTNSTGSVTLTVSGTNALTNGQYIFGNGIPSGTTIASLVDSTHITISAATTTSNTSAVWGTADAFGGAVNVSAGTLTNVTVGANTGSYYYGSYTKAGNSNFVASNTVINGTLTIQGPSTMGVVPMMNNQPGTVGLNFGYAVLNPGVTATNLVVNGRLDLNGSGSLSLSNISGTTNGQTTYQGGGSGVIAINNTYSNVNTLGYQGNILNFSAGAVLGGIITGTNTFATFTQTGVGTTTIGAFQNTFSSVPASAFNMNYTFSGGNWLLGQIAQINSSQQNSATNVLADGAKVTVGTNTVYGGGIWLLNNGSLSFQTNVSTSSGMKSQGQTFGISVANNSSLAVNGTFGLGLTSQPNAVTNTTAFLTNNGGTVSVTGAVSLGGSSTTTNNVNAITLLGGTTTFGNGLTLGGSTTAATVTATTNIATLSGGSFSINGTLTSGSGASETNIFSWTGGNLTVGTVAATNATWSSVGSIANNTLANTNGTLAPGGLGTAGLTTIQGNYSQTGTGTLALDLGGVLAATSFTNGLGYSDQVSVSSNATIAGTIKVTPTSMAFYNIGGSTASSVTLLTATNGLDASSANIVWGDGTTDANKSNNGVIVSLSTNNTSLVANITRNTWSGNGNWGTGGASVWSLGVDPNGTNSFALFNSGSAVNLDRSSTVYALNFLAGGNVISTTNGSSLTLAPGVGTTASLTNVSGNNTVSAPVVLGGNLSAGGSGAVTLSGGVSGGYGVTVTGGTLQLTGGNSYTGSTALNAGTLVTTYNPSTAYAASNSGVTFIAKAASATPWATGVLGGIASQMSNSTFGVDVTGVNYTVADNITNTNGGINFSVLGSGTLGLAANSANSGVTNWSVNGSTLSVTNVSSLTNAPVTLTGNGVLSLDGNSAVSVGNNVTVTSGGFTGSIVNNTGFAVGLTGTLTKNNAILKLLKGSFNVSGNIVGSSANSDLYVSSGANVTLSGNNTYNGATHVDTGSTLVLGSATALPSNTSLVLGSASDTAAQVNTLNLSSYNASASSLSVSGPSTSVVSGSGTLSLSGDLTVANASTLNLGSAVTGVANVNLNGGSLLLNSGSSINPTANVSMNGGSLGLRTPASSFSNLTLTGNSVINFSGLTAGSSLTFTGVVNALNGNTLSVYNYTPSVTSLVFTQGLDASGISSADLSNIQFFSDSGLTSLGSAGGSFSGSEIVPVPEPSVILAAILMVALMAFAKREEISRLARRVAIR